MNLNLDSVPDSTISARQVRDEIDFTKNEEIYLNSVPDNTISTRQVLDQTDSDKNREN